MGKLTLIGESTQKDVYIAVDSLEDDPMNEITRDTSINGNAHKHERWEKPSYRFSTNHMKGSEVLDLENFLKLNDYVVEVSGLLTGTFDVEITSSSYIFFHKDGSPQLTGQVLEITATQIPDTNKWVGEEV